MGPAPEPSACLLATSSGVGWGGLLLAPWTNHHFVLLPSCMCFWLLLPCEHVHTLGTRDELRASWSLRQDGPPAQRGSDLTLEAAGAMAAARRRVWGTCRLLPQNGEGIGGGVISRVHDLAQFCPRGHQAMSVDIFDLRSPKLLVCSVQRPGMLLTIPQCTAPTHPAPNAGSGEVGARCHPGLESGAQRGLPRVTPDMLRVLVQGSPHTLLDPFLFRTCSQGPRTSPCGRTGLKPSFSPGGLRPTLLPCLLC